MCIRDRIPTLASKLPVASTLSPRLLGFQAQLRMDLLCPPETVDCCWKFCSEYTRTVLSEHAVATMGKWGCGALSQVRALQGGLSVARGTRVGIVDVVVTARRVGEVDVTALVAHTMIFTALRTGQETLREWLNVATALSECVLRAQNSEIQA